MYGLATASPTFTPLAKNSTFATVPSASAAVAAIGIDAGAVKAALLAGAVIETVGSAFTMSVMLAESPVTPRLSVACQARGGGWFSWP